MVLRYLLLIVTVICFIALTYGMWQNPRDVPWFIWGIWISLVLNFIYLITNGPDRGRLAGLIGLWIDAKESELRSRIKRGA